MRKKSTKSPEILERAKRDLVNGVEPGRWTGADVAQLEAVYVATVTPPPIEFTPEEVEQALREHNLTDAGNAECMAMLHGDKLRYIHQAKKWYRWGDGYWQEDRDNEAYRLMLATVRARFKAGASIDGEKEAERKKKFAAHTIKSENTRGIRDGLASAANLQPFSSTIEQYDCDPYLANAGGVTIDYRTSATRDAKREDYMTLRLGATYDPAATCPRWLQFLHEVFAGDQDVIAFIRRAVGYSLTGDTREDVMFLCHGKGANGKSTFLNVLGKLSGDYAGSTSFNTFDADRRNEASNDLAALRGKRLVTIVETDEDRRLAEARVKAVTGRDPITCRFLFQEYFTYRPTFKIWLAMNHKPNITGTDDGIWRRILLIPFTQSFKDKPNKQLESQLADELPGILNWALAGLQEWAREGLGVPAAVRQATGLSIA